MTTKEIKSALKLAKESLDQKDYKSAIKQCKSILKVDRNNYLALVFYGAAVQETEQRNEASKAFKKAIELSPDQVLAWRGLACYYEKYEENNESMELLRVYEKLVALESNFVKFSEALEKLEKLTVSLGDYSTIKLITDLLSTADDEKKLLMHQYIVSVLKSDFSEDFIPIYENSLQYLLSIRPHLNNYLDILKKNIKHLYKQNNLESIITSASKALDSFPDDFGLLEWICKAYTELPEDKLRENLSNYSPKEVYTKLIQNAPDSYLGYFCKGLHELKISDLINANHSLKNAAKLKPNLGLIWLKLSNCQLLLYQFPSAEESALKALKYFGNNEKNKKLIFDCEVKLLQSLCEQDDHEKQSQAENLGLKLLEMNPNCMEILEYLTKSLIRLQKYAKADENIKKMSQVEQYEHVAKYLFCISLKHQNKIEECKANLEELVVKAPNYFLSWLELSKIYYNQNNTASCLSCLLKSAKLNEWCYWNFLYLGQCYSKMVKDLEKARRCYQKAFQLNPASAEVGKHLSDIYRILGKEELNLQLLSAATVWNPRSKWAWLKLGLHYLSTNQHQDAITSLQTSVRLDPEDKTAWECLGDAYFSHGAHTSAIKSYQKALELNQDSIYPMLQIAKIKHLIDQCHESVEEFRIINSRISNYVPALLGHSEACLSLLRKYLSENMNGLAQDACQEAVISLTKCLEQQKEIICVWKLLGDCCTLLSKLPEKYCTLKIASWLRKGSKFNDDEEITLDKIQILKLGSQCYCQAIAINSNFSNLWYDLAYVYNCMVQVSKTDESKKQMRELACLAVKKSILLNDNSWESWNLYGIILASKEIQNYYWAHHCFIKAILLLDTNAVTWTNLGTLYLTLNDLQISNQSFTEAQKCDHDYVLCWVGQAMIAQKTGHHDAMDLFRHSTQLGFTSEGCLGYANLVCLTLLNAKNKNDKNYLYSIENMNAVTVAGDLLTWYTDRYTKNPWAFNMLGLLLERRMLYRSSAEAFYRALEVIRGEKSTGTKKPDAGEVSDRILLNYSRVISNLNRYEEALVHLKQIQKANFTNQCELAATYFKANLYEEAYSSYETTLEWLAPDTETKSHILVAMAAVVYLHQGQEDAKILLMQSCQLKPTSVQGLFACCALGMLHSDLALSELALKELEVYKDDSRYLNHIAVFQAYIYLLKGQKEKAIRALLKVIHRYPAQSSLWLSLSLLLLHLHSTSKSPAICAEVALVSGRSSIDVSKVMSLVSLSNLLCGEGRKSLKSAQKAVHMFPDVTENWIVLLASVLSKCLQQESKEEIRWLKKMVSYVRRKFESSKRMTQWLSNNDRKISLMADKLDNKLQ